MLIERLYGDIPPEMKAKDLPEFVNKECFAWEGRPTECGGGLDAEEYAKRKIACKQYWNPCNAECREKQVCQVENRYCIGDWSGPKIEKPNAAKPANPAKPEKNRGIWNGPRTKKQRYQDLLRGLLT